MFYKKSFKKYFTTINTEFTKKSKLDYTPNTRSVV